MPVMPGWALPVWYNVFELEISVVELGAHCLWLTGSLAIPGNSLPLAHKFSGR